MHRRRRLEQLCEVVYRHRICSSKVKSNNAKKTEVEKIVQPELPVEEVEEGGEWISLPGFEQKFWMPELKMPKIELPPRKSATERFEALPAVIEVRKLIADAAKRKDA